MRLQFTKERVGVLKLRTENLELFCTKNSNFCSFLNSPFKIDPERPATGGKVCIKKEGSL
jgi:hypothetical protein